MYCQRCVSSAACAGGLTCEEDVDEQIRAASALKEDSDGRQKDGEDDLDDVATMLSVISSGKIWEANESDCSLRSRRRSFIRFLGLAHLPVKAIFTIVFAQVRRIWGDNFVKVV